MPPSGTLDPIIALRPALLARGSARYSCTATRAVQAWIRVIAPLVILDLVGKLGLVSALLLFPSDSGTATAVAALSAAAAAARAWLRGDAVASESIRAWEQLAAGIRAKSVRELDAVREDEGGMMLLIDGVREVALRRAVTLPECTSSIVALIVVMAVTAVRVSFVWLVVGACSAIALGVVLLPLVRKQWAAQLRTYDSLPLLARDAAVLLGAAPELRTSGREEQRTAGLLTTVRTYARAERDAARFGLVHAVVPAVLAGVAALTPRGHFERLAEAQTVVDLGVLGGASVTLLLAVVRSVEHLRRSGPYVRALEAWRGDPPATSRGVVPARSVELDGVSVTHPGGTEAPCDLSFHATVGGLALLGPNGSGKSTAIRALLGLVEPTGGRVLVDGRPLGTNERLGSVAYLPQRPYVLAGESLRYHLDLAAEVANSAGDLPDGLERLRVADVLRRRGGSEPLDLRMGTLSGGERQKFFIARTLGRDEKVVVLDEPEVGLDADARAALRAWLEDVAKTRIVVVAAHDPSIVPDSFARVVCAAAKSDAGSVLSSTGSILASGAPASASNGRREPGREAAVDRD